MNDGGKLLAVAAIAAVVGAGSSILASRVTGPEAIRNYILTHPEVLPEAMEILKARDLARAVNANRPAIETPFAGAWAGAEKGDVVLVEFFDYACGFCRSSLADIDRLIAEDPKLKVVFREMPVLGQSSFEAAKYSLVAAQQNKYGAFHKALFAAGRPSPETVSAALQKAGIPLDAAQIAAKSKAVDDELRAGAELQRLLNLTGTPGWVIGDKVLVGAVGYDELKQAIAAARKG